MRVYSDEYNKATSKMFSYLKMAAKFPIGHSRRAYWDNKAKEIKAYREEIKSTGNHKFINR